MKKITCVLLALTMVFCLFGCVKQPEPETDPAAQPQSDPAEETPAEGLSFSLPELPDVGEYYNGEKINYFFEDGVPDSFTPRDDYGPLSLYYADVTFYRDITSESEEWSGSEYMCSYGLMTRDGRIVTGADWTEGNLTAMDDETGVFLLRQSQSGSEYEYGYGYTTDLIALDGSWAMHFDRYVAISALFRFGLPYFMITDGMHPTVYSAKDGSPVLSLEAYVPDDPDYAYVPNVIWADENLLLLQTINEYEYNDNNTVTQNGYTALDWNGNVLYTKELVNQDLYAFDQQFQLRLGCTIFIGLRHLNDVLDIIGERARQVQ